MWVPLGHMARHCGTANLGRRANRRPTISIRRTVDPAGMGAALTVIFDQTEAANNPGLKPFSFLSAAQIAVQPPNCLRPGRTGLDPG